MGFRLSFLAFSIGLACVSFPSFAKNNDLSIQLYEEKKNGTEITDRSDLKKFITYTDVKEDDNSFSESQFNPSLIRSSSDVLYQKNFNLVFAPDAWRKYLDELNFKGNFVEPKSNVNQSVLGDLNSIIRKYQFGREVFAFVKVVDLSNRSYYVLLKVNESIKRQNGANNITVDDRNYNNFVLSSIRNLTPDGLKDIYFVPEELMRRITQEERGEIKYHFLKFLLTYLPNIKVKDTSFVRGVPKLTYVSPDFRNYWSEEDFKNFYLQAGLRIKNSMKLSEKQRLVLASYNQYLPNLIRADVPLGNFSDRVESLPGGLSGVRFKSPDGFNYIVLLPKSEGFIGNRNYKIIPDWTKDLNMMSDLELSGGGNESFMKAVNFFAVDKTPTEKALASSPTKNTDIESFSVAEKSSKSVFGVELFPNTLDLINKSSNDEIAKFKILDASKEVKNGVVVYSMAKKNRKIYLLQKASDYNIKGSSNAYFIWDVTNNNKFWNKEFLTLSDFIDSPKVISNDNALLILSRGISSQFLDAIYTFSSRALKDGYSGAKITSVNDEESKNNFVSTVFDNSMLQLKFENQMIRKNYKAMSYAEVIFALDKNYYSLDLEKEVSVLKDGNFNILVNDFFKAKKIDNYKKRLY